MPLTIACPHCSKVLKSSTSIPTGKVIKCPGCKKSFPVPEGDEEAIQAKPPASKMRVPRNGDDEELPRAQRKSGRRDDDDEADDDLPRRKRKRARDEEDEDDEAPRKRRSRDEDDEDDDDRPRKRRSRDDDDEDDRPRSKRRQAKSKKGLIVALAGGGVGLLLLVFLLTAFVWPGFLRSQGAAGGGGIVNAGAQDPLNFLPGDANMVAGVNVAALRNNADFQKSVDKLFQSLPQGAQGQKEVTQGQKDLVLDADLAMFAANTNMGGSQGAAVIAMRKPQDPEKVRQALNATPTQNQQGKATMFQGTNGEIVSLPTPQIIILGKMSQAQMNQLVERKTPALNAELLTQVRRVKGNSLWAVFAVEGPMKQQFQQLKAEDLKKNASLAGLADALPALQQSKAITIHADIPADGKTMKLSAGLVCAGSGEASKAAGAVDKVWKESGKGLLEMAKFGAMMAGIQDKGLNGLLGDVTNSLKVQAEGPVVTVQVTFSESTLKELEKAGQNMAGFPGGGNPPPNKNLPPGKNPPGKKRFPGAPK